MGDKNVKRKEREENAGRRQGTVKTGRKRGNRERKKLREGKGQ